MRKIGAQNLQTALQSNNMKQFQMSTFACILLQRYGDQLVAEQKKALAVWEEKLCASRLLRAEDREALTARFVCVQEFLAKFAAEIVQLQKQNLRDVVMSNQAHNHAEWMQAQKFVLRHYGFLGPEEKDLLEDWEITLCNMSSLESVAYLTDTSVAFLPRPALESVAFLPRLQRFFQRVDSFATEHAEALKKIAGKNLHTALRRQHMAQLPTSTFTRIFLERYKDKLSTEQMEAVSIWEENLCALSTVDREAVSAKRVETFTHVQEFFAKFAAEIVQLQKQNLRDVAMSNQAHNHAEWMQAQKFFLRHYGFLGPEEKDLLEDWEFTLCNMSSLESVAFLPRLTRSFERVKAVVVAQSDTFKLQKKISLVDIFQSADMQAIPMCCFCAFFLKRYLERLSAAQIAEVERWEREFCVTEAELVDKFLDVATKGGRFQDVGCNQC